MIDSLTTLFSTNWILVVFVIVFATLLLNFVLRRFLGFLKRKALTTENLWDDALVDSFKLPLEWAVWLFGLNFAASYTAQVNDLSWLKALVLINKTSVVVLLAWVGLRFVASIEVNLTSDKYLRKPVDRATGKAIRKLLQASIVITAILVVLQLYGISISGVLAFGGIGGIAIGFAAQDLLSNFFGAIMIYLDKPFAVGDWIRSSDRDIEGVVEDIGWRQTVIRTFDMRPLYVPNSVFSKIAVENPSRMSNRRIYETIGVRYDDASKVANIVSKVKAMLVADPRIDQNRTMIVNLNEFASSSVDFFIYTFTKTTDWVLFHEIKQDILLKVERIVAEEGAEIAFPTRTLHLEQPLPQPLS